jgi:hypothetical protein
MFPTNTSFKNFAIHTPIKSHAGNFGKAAIIMTQIGKEFGIMKPSMWMIFHPFNWG